MYKRRNLTGFFVFYIALGVIVYLILRFAYGEPFFNVFKLGYANIALGIFFYDTVYAKYNKLGLFEVEFNFDRTAALLLSKSVFKRFLLFLKYFGFVEVLYILYSFFYPSLEADLGFSLSERAQRIIYYFHRGFWFWLWIWVFAVAPQLFGYMLLYIIESIHMSLSFFGDSYRKHTFFLIFNRQRRDNQKKLVTLHSKRVI